MDFGLALGEAVGKDGQAGRGPDPMPRTQDTTQPRPMGAEARGGRRRDVVLDSLRAPSRRRAGRSRRTSTRRRGGSGDSAAPTAIGRAETQGGGRGGIERSQQGRAEKPEPG